MPGPTPPHCHLFVILARETSKAVILRRGPTRWYRLSTWDTQHDTFEHGQWFYGRIYERRCNLSPDGDKLVYFAQKINRQSIRDTEYTYAWTAVSKPPYLTALALWPKGDCWAGGGLFDSEKSLWLNHDWSNASPHPDHVPPSDFQVVIDSRYQRGEDSPIYFGRLARDGWVLIQNYIDADPTSSGKYVFKQPFIWHRDSPEGRYKLSMEWWGIDHNKSGSYQLRFSILHKNGSFLFPINADVWADWDQRGRLVYAKNGQLFAASIENESLRPQLLIDFSHQKPESIAPPEWATRW